MGILSNFVQKIHSLATYLENYKLLQVRLDGGIPDLYKKLDQPWFRDLGIVTVLDIGANIGQSTISLSKLLPEAEIYAFEPIPDCFSKLENKFNGSKNVHTLNVGLGAESGNITFERNNFSPSSSFRKMTDIHKNAFPFTRESEEIKVQIEKLDKIVDSLKLQEPILAKIDVQGYEDNVIDGGEVTLSKCKILIIETSFNELYIDQTLFAGIYDRLVLLGFKYMGSLEQVCSPKTGGILQADSLFIRH